MILWAAAQQASLFFTTSQSLLKLMSILLMGFSRQCWSGLPFPPPVDHVWSELSTMTHPSWVALPGTAHSFTELGKPFYYDKDRRWSMKWIWIYLFVCIYLCMCIFNSILLFSLGYILSSLHWSKSHLCWKSLNIHLYAVFPRNTLWISLLWY